MNTRKSPCVAFATHVSLSLVAVMGTAVAQGADELQEVTVTGSRIKGAANSGATSLTIVSAEALDAQGYRNVYDALNSLTQNTGFTQGADFGNTFTPAANAISLRGLGPNHTLVLVNGRRVAEYPAAYNGEVNFVNLANVPAASIDRIEVLNNGASAIYGSDAIAGVVNIITKQNLEGVELDLKAGTTQRGGGDNWRIQASGGHRFERLSATFAAELSKTDPIWSRQRDFMSSTTLEGATPTNVWSQMNLDRNRYIDPAGACSTLASNFDGTTAANTGSRGTFCASGNAQPDYWTVQTANESQNAYGALNFELNSTTTLFANAILAFNRTENNTRGPNWTSAAANDGFFFNQSSGNNEVWTRRVAPEEIGGAERFNRIWQDRSLNSAFGVRGDVGLKDWTYEAGYNFSSYLSRNLRPRLLAAVDSYFLGPQLGVDADGVPIYAPDSDTFNRAIDPSEIDTLIGRTKSRDITALQTVTLSANGTAFDLPAGPLGAAAVLEWGDQRLKNRPDPGINDGLYFNTAPQDTVRGTRRRYAAALEFSVPVVDKVNAKLAGRYDDYAFAGRGDNKFTYDAGLTFRPIESVLLRGNYATSFRAPDMSYIYQTLVRGFYSATTDYWRCAEAGQDLSDCEFADVSPGSNFTSTGNGNLKFENGKSFGYGIVWSPLSRVSLSVDYWNIRIDDLVTNIDSDRLLRIEADCREGTRDVASAQCSDALTRVRRNPPDAVLNPNAISVIQVNPINAAFVRTDGIDATTRTEWNFGAHGFLWTINYSKVLKFKGRQFEGDATDDLLHDLTNVDWRSKLITDLTWSIDKYSSTVQVSRYGKVPDAAQEAYLTPTSLVNLSTSYRFSEKSSVTLIVQNVFDEIKPDGSFGWPFYPVGNYLPYGRQGWVQFNYRLGQ